MAVIQYPQYMYAKRTAATSTRDENGVFIPNSSGSWRYVGKCRYESNGKGTEIKTDDSKTVVFSGVAYSQTAEDVSNNTQIIITRSEHSPDDIPAMTGANWARNPDIVIVGMNLKTDKTQMHTKYYIN